MYPKLLSNRAARLSCREKVLRDQIKGYTGRGTGEQPKWSAATRLSLRFPLCILGSVKALLFLSSSGLLCLLSSSLARSCELLELLVAKSRFFTSKHYTGDVCSCLARYKDPGWDGRHDPKAISACVQLWCKDFTEGCQNVRKPHWQSRVCDSTTVSFFVHPFHL